MFSAAFPKQFVWFLFVVYLVLPGVSGSTISRTETCAGIYKGNGTYNIQVFNGYFESAYHYIPVAYNISAPSAATYYPKITVTIPTAPINSASQLCCDSNSLSCKRECAITPVAVLDPSTSKVDQYSLLLTEKDSTILGEIKAWGVRYYSLELLYKLTDNANTITAGVTLALYDCTPRDVTFITNTSETVRVRRLAFSDKNRIDIYDIASRLNGLPPPGAEFFVSPSSGTPSDLFSIDGTYPSRVLMDTSKVTLATSDVNYTVILGMTAAGQPQQTLNLLVNSRAENRYSPAFLDCEDPDNKLYISTVSETCFSDLCPITELIVADNDLDDLYFHSFELISLSQTGRLLDVFEKSFTKIQSGRFSLKIWQKRKLSEDDLYIWAEQAGPKGFLLLNVTVKDRENIPGLVASCTMRINLPDSVFSSVPKFISPGSDLRIAVPHNTALSTTITQVLAVDMLRQKLLYPYRLSRQVTYSLSDNTRNGNSKSAVFQVDPTTGKVFLIGILEQPPKKYTLNINASFTSRYSWLRNVASAATVTIYVDIVSNNTAWTPRLETAYIPPVDDGVIPFYSVFTSFYVTTPASFTFDEFSGIQCSLVDYSQTWPASVYCNSAKDAAGNRYKVDVLFRPSASTSASTFGLDFSNDRLLHVRVKMNHRIGSTDYQNEGAVILELRDSNTNAPVAYGTYGCTVPEDAPPIEVVMNVKQYDADLVQNNAVSCSLRVVCGNNRDIFEVSPSNVTHTYIQLRRAIPPNSHGECSFILTDSIYSSDGKSCQDTNKFNNIPAPFSSIKILEQPVSHPPVSLYCPDGIPQASRLLLPLNNQRCKVIPSSSESTVSSDTPDNMFFFVNDSSGTFAANPQTGQIYLLQPIVAATDTASQYWNFPLQLSVFNGRYWNSTTTSIKVVNNLLSKPNLIDIYEFASPNGDVIISETVPDKVSVPVPSDPDNFVLILNMTLKQSAMHIFQNSYNIVRSPRSVILAHNRQNTRATTSNGAPYVVGASALSYKFVEVVPNQKWSLYYIGSNSTTRFRTSKTRSSTIQGSTVTIAVNYSVNAGGSTPVTVGNTASLIMGPGPSPRIDDAFPLWAILVIVFGIIFLLILLLIVVLLATRRQKQKVGSPDLPGTPVKYVTGQLQSNAPFTPVPPLMSPNSDMDGELALDNLLATRLANADLTMTTSSGQRGHDVWHGDDGLDTITVSSGYTDAPLNLSVLNQFGQEYSNLAETCGVARRV